MDIDLEIENATAISANFIASSLGYVLVPYVLVGFIYGRIIRKYRRGVVFLGFVFAVIAYAIAELTMSSNQQYLLPAAIVSCFIGIELSDLLLSKFQKKSPVANPADLATLIQGKAKTGIAISSEDGCTILGVANGSPAQLAGILPGDRLVTIDGSPCEKEYQSNVLRLVGEAGSVVRIAILRGEISLDFAFVRA